MLGCGGTVSLEAISENLLAKDIILVAKVTLIVLMIITLLTKGYSDNFSKASWRRFSESVLITHADSVRPVGLETHLKLGTGLEVLRQY